MAVHLAFRRTDPPGLARLFALATRARLLTQWPHAGIVMGGELLHATLAHGLHAVPFDAPDQWDVLPLPDCLAEQVRQRFLERQGAQYDAISLLAFLLPWRVSDARRLYCFEWCWYALTGANPSWRVTPEQLLWLAARLGKGVA